MKGREDPFREWDVAYVLGSLPNTERARYEIHLRSCSACANEVATLAGMPGVLAAVPPEYAASLLPPSQADGAAVLVPGLLRATATARRQAQIWMAVALVSAAALGLALLAFV